MDIQMPNMDGYQTSKEIRKLKSRRATVPVIAMTANAFEEDRKKAFIKQDVLKQKGVCHGYNGSRKFIIFIWLWNFRQ